MEKFLNYKESLSDNNPTHVITVVDFGDFTSVSYGVHGAAEAEAEAECERKALDNGGTVTITKL